MCQQPVLVFGRHDEASASDLSLADSSNSQETRRKTVAHSGFGKGWKDRKVIVSLMMVCAVLASMAFGVLVAYGICLAFFRLMGASTAAVPARNVVEVPSEA